MSTDPVTPIASSRLTAHHLTEFLQDDPDAPFLALSAAYGAGRKLEWIALVHGGDQPLVIQIVGRNQKPQGFRTILEDFLDKVTPTKLIAYNADVLAAGLFLDCGVRLKHCIDIQSIDKNGDKASFSYTRNMIQKDCEETLTYNEYLSLFDDRAKSPDRLVTLVERGTMALMVMRMMTGVIPREARINAGALSDEVIVLVAQLLRGIDRVDALKPIYKKHDVASTRLERNGDLAFVSSRFKTRIQRHQDQQISKIKFSNSPSVTATTKSVKGKTGTFKLGGPMKKNGSRALSITTIGKDAATQSEAQIRQIVRLVLSGREQIFTSNHIICQLFGLAAAGPCPASSKFRTSFSPSRISFQLNPAQDRAVQAFCSPENYSGPLVQLVHGPPGTGKTTLIASIIQGLTSNSEAIYACAQSNVAVKNIAVKLAKAGFTGFKLIVSEDFYFEWHDHLYEAISDNVIRTSNLPRHASDMERRLGRARVILSTLPMLSNQRLVQCGLTKQLLKPTILIVDEASQISLPDYLPSFDMFKKTIKRICFVGDHKQLPPYGQNQVPTLESVFEMEHLTPTAYLLDTQYRMPSPIGNFISRNVYDNKLRTQHKINAWSCCRFVDVQGTETKQGTSSMNKHEARSCVRIARQLQKNNKGYCIITAYDAQRQLIEDMLKDEKLRWEHKVFNVDSFQGNEEDFIIISVVRTKSPGFLVDKRRTNVMLTRCKKGMVILVNRGFLDGAAAKETLVAKLAGAMKGPWLTEHDILNGRRVFV